MIFSELYSTYYQTVGKIITKAISGKVSAADISKEIMDTAFSESVLAIMPALTEERWQLFDREFETVIKHEPSMPMTDLEKGWLKAVFQDPRIRLFYGCSEPKWLQDTEPLFSQEDYRIFDRYDDGDDFSDEGYIERFRLIVSAIRSGRPMSARYINRRGRVSAVRFFPQKLEYSEKDDKFRVIVTGCRYSTFNLGKLVSCEYYKGHGPWKQEPEPEEQHEIVLVVRDERNALERVIMHFAHFEKRAERIDYDRQCPWFSDDIMAQDMMADSSGIERNERCCCYKVRIKYYEHDETEIVIRVLSFGPFVRVVEPESFVDLIRERLAAQITCELR